MNVQELERMKLIFDYQDLIKEFIGKELDEFSSECQQMEEMIKVQKKLRVEMTVTAFLFQRWKENSEKASFLPKKPL